MPPLCSIRRNDTSSSPKPTYGSVEELAAELGVCRGKAYEMLKTGIIPAIRHGKRFIIPRAAVAAWLENAGKE